MNLAELRIDYEAPALCEADLDADPLRQFRHWLAAALAAGLPEPHAMTLATATPDGTPSARVVLLRGCDERGFVFYTNFDSRKGRELTANPRAALVFYWHPLHRQVRVEGTVERVADAEADEYFRSRPRGSQLGAWASPQSEVIPSRELLEQRVADILAQHPGGVLPRPPFWGGYRVVPTALEFWQGRPSRLHDRFRYARQGTGGWRRDRLGP